MALTQADVAMWEELAERGLIPRSPRVLEIGQANWYGDVEAPACCKAADPFVVARNFYRHVLEYSEIVAIDWSGPDALHFDLNEPIRIDRNFVCAFNVVINSGTTEHVFNQHQVFKTIHDVCAPGGLMVHAVPWKGWEEHGFYCYQPGFFVDLAAFNGYELLYLRATGEGNVLLYVVLRKERAAPFRVPAQGRYALHTSTEAQ